MKKFFCAMFFLILGISSAEGKKPDWLSGKSKKYPEEKYLIGVGVGASMDVARENARAEILKIFKAKITQSVEEVSREESKKKTGAKEVFSSVSVEQRTSVFVDDVLEGIEISQVWHDRRNKTYYSLAALDKKKFKRNLMSQITDMDENILSHLKRSKTGASKLEGLKYLSRARKLSEKKEEMRAKLRVVEDVSLPILLDELSAIRIESMMEKIKDEFLFCVITDDETTVLKKILSERLSDLGFKVVGDASLADLIVNAKLNVVPLHREKTHWKFYTWSGHFEIKEKEKIISSATMSGTESHPDEKTAFEKAKLAGEKSIADVFEVKLNDILEN